MRRQAAAPGHTLIEVVVALLIFTVGVLSLAASSGLVTRAMASNAQRERAYRIATNKIAVIKSRCGSATSGSSLEQGIESGWSVTRLDSGRVMVTAWVSYESFRGARTDTYRATLWCRD